MMFEKKIVSAIDFGPLLVCTGAMETIMQKKKKKKKNGKQNT